MKKTFNTKNAPQPSPSFSQAVIHNNVAYICGQMSADPLTGESIHGSVAEQTKNALDNLKAIVTDLNSQMENVLMVNIYISDVKVFPDVDQVYRTYFPINPPARATVAVKQLCDNLDVEITAIVAV